MDLRYFIFLLATVSSVYCADRGKDRRGKSYIRILGKFTCEGRSIGDAYAEVKESDFLIDSTYETMNLKNGVIDIIIYGHDPQPFANDDGMEIYVKVWYNCGCGKTYQTYFAPQNHYYATEREAYDHPWNFGTRDIMIEAQQGRC